MSSSTILPTSGVSICANDSVQPVQDAPSIHRTGNRLPFVAPMTDSSIAIATRGAAAEDNPAATATAPQNLRKSRRETPLASSKLSNSAGTVFSTMCTSSFFLTLVLPLPFDADRALPPLHVKSRFHVNACIDIFDVLHYIQFVIPPNGSSKRKRVAVRRSVMRNNRCVHIPLGC